MFIILYLFQLNENSVLLRFSFPIIFHFEFRLKVTINQSFPSTVTPPSKSINVCQINEKGDFRRISHFYPNLRFPDCNISRTYLSSMLFPDSGRDAPVPSSMLFPDSGFEIVKESLGRNPVGEESHSNT